MEQKQERKRAGMGRRRVEIKRIEDKARRQTTFTKRRDGLFKKTGELCNLCGTEAAVITFSNAGNTYAFGNPSVDSVINRFLAITSSSSAAVDGGAADERVKERQDKLAEALARLEVEKKRREEIDKALGMLKVNAPVEDSVVREFGKEVKAMEELLDKLRSEADLEAQKKLEEAADEMLAMLNAQNEASRSEELEQEDEDTDEEMTDNGNESQ